MAEAKSSSFECHTRLRATVFQTKSNARQAVRARNRRDGPGNSAQEGSGANDVTVSKRATRRTTASVLPSEGIYSRRSAITVPIRNGMLETSERVMKTYRIAKPAAL